MIEQQIGLELSNRLDVSRLRTDYRISFFGGMIF